MKIYAVKTNTDTNSYVLGYATGDPEDIKAYFKPKEVYGLDVKEINIVHISPEDVEEIKDLREEKRVILQRLRTIEDMIDGKLR